LNSGRDKMKGIQLIARYDSCVMGEKTVEVSRSACTPLKQNRSEFDLCSNSLPATPIVLTCSDRSTDLRGSFFERTNCPGSKGAPDQDWAAEVSCPIGMVASGMKLSTRGSGGGRTMIDGVALECVRLSLP
jgi:hypothetical protein